MIARNGATGAAPDNEMTAGYGSAATGVMMADDSFQLAAERARGAYSLSEWINMRPREQSDAIYRELRLIDAVRVAERTARRRTGGAAEPQTVDAV